jgi:hypothetical protein
LGTAPLGRATSEWDGHAVHFWSAWPVAMRAGLKGKVIAAVWDYPVAAYRPEGAGGVLVVGDGSFLSNKNLEDVQSYNEHNILFFRELLREFGAGRKSHD